MVNYFLVYFTFINIILSIAKKYVPPVPVVIPVSGVRGPSSSVTTLEPASTSVSPGAVKGGNGLPEVEYPGVEVNPFELG